MVSPDRYVFVHFDVLHRAHPYAEPAPVTVFGRAVTGIVPVDIPMLIAMYINMMSLAGQNNTRHKIRQENMKKRDAFQRAVIARRPVGS